jgi:hypothetical protein
MRAPDSLARSAADGRADHVQVPPHGHPIDADGQLASTDRLPGKGKDTLDQRHPDRQVTALSQEARKLFRWLGDDEIADSEFAIGPNSIEPDRYAFGCVPHQTRRRFRRQR